MVCQRAVTLIVDLCLHNSTLLDRDTCEDYLFLLSSQGSDQKQPGKADTACVLLFAFANVALKFDVRLQKRRLLCLHFLCLCVSRLATLETLLLP